MSMLMHMFTLRPCFSLMLGVQVPQGTGTSSIAVACDIARTPWCKGCSGPSKDLCISKDVAQAHLEHRLR